MTDRVEPVAVLQHMHEELLGGHGIVRLVVVHVGVPPDVHGVFDVVFRKHKPVQLRLLVSLTDR